nr:diguanylate cyclase [Salinicola sp. S1-1-2]
MPWLRERRLSSTCIRERLRVEVARATAMDRPLSVLVLYIPQLDQADDQFGTQLRETLSETFSEVVTHNSRHNDLLGECRENVFWLALPNSREAGALAAAKRLSNAIVAISQPEIGPLESCTRVCTLVDGEEADHFLERLDRAADKLLEPQA